ncbi:MAG: hypothetical protein R3C11_13285 [Planctomycetaceae bacterium]
MLGNKEQIKIAIHQIHEPPAVDSDFCGVSIWVCIGPFPEEMWHAEDHPNAIAFCRSEPVHKAEEILFALEQMLMKLSIDYTKQEYPGD